MRHTVLALLSFAVVAILAAPAGAATLPVARTAPATGIGPLGATINGSVTPNGHDTKIHFQWGATKNYGNTTPVQDVGAGTTPVPIAATLTGLKSSTRYHFRVVAVSSAGTKRSGDRSFKTLAPTTAVFFTPNPAIFTKPFTISGQLVGSGAGKATVTLFGRPFPFTAPFTQVGNPVVSNADGTYAFAITSASSTTQFQIKANTNPPITTPVATLPVSSLISLHVRSHVRKGRLLRFAGSVLPAQDGLIVKIQKRDRAGNFHTVAHTNLHHANSAKSTYSRRLRIKRRGTYRTMVVSANASVFPGFSPAKSIRVTRH
jgi:hypothetical protein